MRGKWYTTEDKVSKEEKVLRRLVMKLYRISKRYGLRYTDVYTLSTEGSTSINIRAKRGEDVVVNSYKFIRGEI